MSKPQKVNDSYALLVAPTAAVVIVSVLMFAVMIAGYVRVKR